MLEARELRLGNTIECYLGAPISESMEIIVKATTLVNFDKYPKTSYHPIPLTEEWLDKFGFIHNGMWWDSSQEYFELDTFKDSYVMGINSCEYNHGIEIKHVHQLQNLYFALTGEELKIK